jgi:hypothetical protein
VCAIRRKLLSPRGTRGVSYRGLAVYIKRITKRKKNYGNSNISPYQNIILRKNPLKENQNRSRYHNSITNLKFQHKPKISWFKNPHIKIDLLARGL